MKHKCFTTAGLTMSDSKQVTRMIVCFVKELFQYVDLFDTKLTLILSGILLIMLSE
jgi:hypothetical protein